MAKPRHSYQTTCSEQPYSGITTLYLMKWCLKTMRRFVKFYLSVDPLVLKINSLICPWYFKVIFEFPDCPPAGICIYLFIFKISLLNLPAFAPRGAPWNPTQPHPQPIPDPYDLAPISSPPTLPYRIPSLYPWQRSIRHKIDTGRNLCDQTDRLEARVATRHSSLTPHSDQGRDPTRLESGRTIYYIHCSVRTKTTCVIYHSCQERVTQIVRTVICHKRHVTCMLQSTMKHPTKDTI